MHLLREEEQSMSDFEYQGGRRIRTDDGALFVPVCPECRQFVKAYDEIVFSGDGQPHGPNATCKVHELRERTRLLETENRMIMTALSEIRDRTIIWPRDQAGDVLRIVHGIVVEAITRINASKDSAG